VYVCNFINLPLLILCSLWYCWTTSPALLQTEVHVLGSRSNSPCPAFVHMYFRNMLEKLDSSSIVSEEVTSCLCRCFRRNLDHTPHSSFCLHQEANTFSRLHDTHHTVSDFHELKSSFPLSQLTTVYLLVMSVVVIDRMMDFHAFLLGTLNWR